jgi:aminoglycoside phosphotransferase (APT) family kinase protein
MPEQVPIRPQEVLAAMGITFVSEIEPVTGGIATATWRVLWMDGHYVLRVFGEHEVAASKRETAAMEAASAADITVPSIVRRGMWEGRPALLLSWLSGEPLFTVLQEQPDLTEELGMAWGQIHAAIHKISPPTAFDANEWIEWAGENEGELKARLREVNPLHPALLHLDYHPMNVMVDGTEISGIIDWAHARAGDPRVDLARTVTILRFANIPPQSDLRSTRAFRLALECAWRRGYRQAGGKFEDMALFHAWAGAAMYRDLAPLLENPDSGIQEHDPEPVRRWRDTWKQRAGIAV